VVNQRIYTYTTYFWQSGDFLTCPRGTIPQIIQHQTIPVSKPMVLRIQLGNPNVGDGLWFRVSGAQASLAEVSGSQQMTYISQRPTAEVGECWYDPIHLAEL